MSKPLTVDELSTFLDAIHRQRGWTPEERDVGVRACAMALASLREGGAVAWIRTRNGQIDWSEDCLAESKAELQLDCYEEDDHVAAMPLYARHPAASAPLQQTDEQGRPMTYWGGMKDQREPAAQASKSQTDRNIGRSDNTTAAHTALGALPVQSCSPPNDARIEHLKKEFAYVLSLGDNKQVDSHHTLADELERCPVYNTGTVATYEYVSFQMSPDQRDQIVAALRRSGGADALLTEAVHHLTMWGRGYKMFNDPLNERIDAYLKGNQT